MTLLDGFAIGLYGVAALVIGLAVSRRHADSADLLLGGRRLAPWAVFLSMVATELSAATFIGVPQAAYRGDWSYLQLAVGALLGKVVIATWVLPVYYARRVTTVYGFLEESFGPRTRRDAALCFIGGRLLASGVRLFIAGIAFAAVTDVRIEIAIAMCGLVAGLYTSVGGIRAVIYTDVLQAIVLMAGAGCLLAAALSAGAGLEATLAWAQESGRSQILHTAPLFSLSDGRALSNALIGGFFLTLATHSTDHDMVQRLLTTPDARGAGRALIGSALLNFPLTLLFLAIGTAIAHAHLEPPGYAIGETERILPLFARHELPDGVRGIVFAGLFAAAMSSLDSAICAISATWTVDVARPRQQKRLENNGLTDVVARRARMSSALLTILLVAIAIGMSHYQRSFPTGAQFGLIELALSSMTILYGGLLGVFACGLLSPRHGDDRSARIGLAVGAVTGAGLFLHPLLLEDAHIAWTWWIPISAILAFCITRGLPGRSERRPP